jgi:hypothetical protein
MSLDLNNLMSFEEELKRAVVDNTDNTESSDTDNDNETVFGEILTKIIDQIEANYSESRSNLLDIHSKGLMDLNLEQNNNYESSNSK